MKNVSFLLFGFLILFFDGSAVRAEEQDDSVELKEIVVTATRQPENTERIPAQVTVITREKIESSNAAHLGDLLQSEGGLWVSNTSGSSPTGIFIESRGFNNGGGSGSRMLVLMDGRRINLPDSSSPDWSVIPIDSIERIEIVHGSSTALYGDNAMAGVINIITRKGGKELHGSASLTAGSYESWKRNFSLSGTLGTTSYYLFGGYETTEGYRENSDYRASNFIGNFENSSVPGTTFRLRAGYTATDRLLPGALTEAEIEAGGRRDSVTENNDGGVNQFLLDAGVLHHFSRDSWVDLSGGRIERGDGSLITYTGAGDLDVDSDTRSNALSGKYGIKKGLAGRDNQFIIGFDLLKERVKSKSLSDFPPFLSGESSLYERGLPGLFAQDEFTIMPSLILTAANRTDWSRMDYSRETVDLIGATTTFTEGDRSFRFNSPKAGLTFLPAPFLKIFGTWSKSFRFPNRDELTGFLGLTPELDPEKATTVEFGTELRFNPFGEAKISVFRSDVEDELFYIPPPYAISPLGENQNVPEVRHEGIELSGSLRFAPKVRLNGTYILNRTEMTEGPVEKKQVPITPKQSGKASLAIGGTKGFRLNLQGRFVGPRVLVNDLGHTSENLPGYAVMDARLNWNSFKGGLFFGANNLFDKEYSDWGGIGFSGVGFNPSPERNFLGGGTLRF